MSRGGTSAYALTLPQIPPERSAALVEVLGRETIARRGVFFTKIGRMRRSVIQQFDGETILADECKCATDWQPDFEVTRSWDCPIDQHRVQALEVV
jgi:hypothetical protein